MSEKSRGKRAVKKPMLNGLPGDYVLPNDLRDKCGLTILTARARDWPSVERLVDDYFQDANTWSSSYLDMYRQLLDGLRRLENDALKPCVKSYAKEVGSYLQAPCIAGSFQKYYRLQERIATQRQEARLAQIEGNITGAVLTQQGAKRLLEIHDDQAPSSSSSSRRRISVPASSDECVQTDPYKSHYSFVSNGKRFDYHTPLGNLVSAKRPVLSHSDHSYLSDLFDICLSSSKAGGCSQDTQELYDHYSNEQHSNKCIKARPGALELLNTSMLPANFLDTRKLWLSPGEGKFLDMMRYILADYYQTCRRSSPINANHERTFFCECIVPIFKHFAVMTGCLTGEWCEKQMQETRRVWLPLKDFKASGISRKLHDGILSNEAETVAVIIESSGSEDSTAHIIDDTYKQLKSTSDFYKHLISNYNMCSLKTLMDIKVPCVTVIGNCLTLCLTTIHNDTKWKFVEARSCIVPTHADEKRAWIKVFEFLACLEDVVNSSLKSIEQLENESLGYVSLNPDELLVKDYLS